jgi:hypothetical protein
MHYLFIALGVAAVAFALYLRHKALCAASWPSTDGVIIQSALVGNGPDKDISVLIRYRYTVASQTFENTQVSYAMISNSFQAKQDRVALYPVGRAVRVYYNPESPQDAVLENGQNRGWLVVAVIGAIFVFAGLVAH